jgi:hypothetical protein
MVAAPSMISRPRRGTRPSTVETSVRPRTGVTAKTRTCRPLTVISSTVASVIRPILGSRRSPVSTAPVISAPEPLPSLVKYTWYGTP